MKTIEETLKMLESQLAYYEAMLRFIETNEYSAMRCGYLQDRDLYAHGAGTYRAIIKWINGEYDKTRWVCNTGGVVMKELE